MIYLIWFGCALWAKGYLNASKASLMPHPYLFTLKSTLFCVALGPFALLVVFYLGLHRSGWRLFQ